MSKVKDTYRVHDNIESARQFEMKETGRTHWSRDEPPPWYEPEIVDHQSILIKCILLIMAILLPIGLTLLSFKYVYRAFIIAGLLFLSTEQSTATSQPVQSAKVSGLGILLAGGAILGAGRKSAINYRLVKEKKGAPCQKRGPFRLWDYYNVKSFNPIRK